MGGGWAVVGGGVVNVTNLHLTITFELFFLLLKNFVKHFYIFLFYSKISCVIYTVEGWRDEGKYSLDVSFLYLSQEPRQLTSSLRFSPSEDEES